MLLIRGEGGALGPSGDGGVSVLRGGESVEIAAVGEVPSRGGEEDSDILFRHSHW